MVVQAQFNYKTSHGAITITKYTGTGGAVTIPSTINNLPVTAIGTNAFRFMRHRDQRYDSQYRNQYRGLCLLFVHQPNQRPNSQ